MVVVVALVSGVGADVAGLVVVVALVSGVGVGVASAGATVSVFCSQAASNTAPVRIKI